MDNIIENMPNFGEPIEGVLIRQANVRDIREVCRLVQQMSPSTPHDYREAEQKFKYSIKHNPDYFLWVAECEGPWAESHIIGTAMLHLQHKLSYQCGTAAHLEDVVVEFKCRGQGVGTLLIQRAIKTALDHDCYKIMLTCWEETVPYYQKLGFKKHGYEMRMSLKEEY